MEDHAAEAGVFPFLSCVVDFSFFPFRLHFLSWVGDSGRWQRGGVRAVDQLGVEYVRFVCHAGHKAREAGKGGVGESGKKLSILNSMNERRTEKEKRASKVRSGLSNSSGCLLSSSSLFYFWGAGG